MPSEKEIREAIADVIRLTVDATTTVIPRDAMGLFRNGDYTPFEAGGQYLRGWVVSLQSTTLSDALSGGAEYGLTFSVWQLHQYFTGTNENNSEDIASAEREAVMAALSYRAGVAGIQQATLDALAMVDPISFSTITTAPSREGGQLFHWAQGTVTARWRTHANC